MPSDLKLTAAGILAHVLETSGIHVGTTIDRKDLENMAASLAAKLAATSAAARGVGLDELTAETERLGLYDHQKPARWEACGCVRCVCEDPVRCHGCGAKLCSIHAREAVQP